MAVSALNLFNTRGAAFLLYIGTDVIAIYIFLQFLNTISVALDEAAMLEGASYFLIYRKIILPLLKPAVATVLIIKSVGIYNDFYTPYLYMPRANLRVISTALFQFRGQYGSQWEIICAGVMITIIPVLIMFLFMQRYIYNGLTADAGLEYYVSSALPGRNRILYERNEIIALNQTIRNICAGSPYVRISNKDDIDECERSAPGWIIGTLDSPVVSFLPYIWRRGNLFMEIVDWLLSGGKIVNVLPHTISRYARILQKKGYIRSRLLV